VRPVNLNQLLIHPKTDALSFFLSPLNDFHVHNELDEFFEDMKAQLLIQERDPLEKLLDKNLSAIKKIIKTHPDQSYGFFLSKELQGHTLLRNKTTSFCIIGKSFHFRPVLEELFVNPEFILVNVSLYDIKIYRGDFQYIEIFELFDFDQLPKEMNHHETQLFAPQYLGAIPYKTIIALKSVSQKIKDMLLYESIPVVVTGIEVMKSQFLRFLEESSGLLTQFNEDFFEKDTREILQKCSFFRPAITNYYSHQLKERLKRMTNSKLILSDLKDIIKATFDGKVTHLVLPPDVKIWGTLDKNTGEFTLHKKMLKTSVDLLSELAEEVVKQGGGLKILQPHFFPQNVYALAILRGPL
jgi:hypothetical protein